MSTVRGVGLLAGIALAAWSAAAGADLVTAARSDDRSAALAELERGADAKARSADGTTALHWAIYHDDVELVDAVARGRR